MMEQRLQDLVEAHRDRAGAIAAATWRTAPHALELEELRSLAYEGLVKAASMWDDYCQRNSFDPGRIEYFTPYAERRMRGAIFDQLRSADWATRSQRTKHKQLQDAGIDQGATEQELSARTGLTVDDIRATLAGMGRRPVSLDAETMDYVDPADVHEEAHQAGFLRVLVMTVSSLPEPQQVVLALHYYSGLELQQVAELMNITESRASHLHTDAVLVVREALREALGV